VVYGEKNLKSLKMDDVGEIIPGLNQDYDTNNLRY